MEIHPEQVFLISESQSFDSVRKKRVQDVNLLETLTFFSDIAAAAVLFS